MDGQRTKGQLSEEEVANMYETIAKNWKYKTTAELAKLIGVKRSVISTAAILMRSKGIALPRHGFSAMSPDMVAKLTKLYQES